MTPSDFPPIAKSKVRPKSTINDLKTGIGEKR